MVSLAADRASFFVSDSRTARALAAQSPLVAVAAARANADLRLAVDRLRPSLLIGAPEFREAAPNRRSILFDYRELRGEGPLLRMAYASNDVPHGAIVVYRGLGYLLWRSPKAEEGVETEDR